MGTEPFEAAQESKTSGEVIDRQRKIRAAQDWLRGELALGPRAAGDVQRRGELAGHNRRTLQEAAHRLHVTPERVYQGNRLVHWQWALPTVPARRGRPPKK